MCSTIMHAFRPLWGHPFALFWKVKDKNYQLFRKQPIVTMAIAGVRTDFFPRNSTTPNDHHSTKHQLTFQYSSCEGAHHPIIKTAVRPTSKLEVGGGRAHKTKAGSWVTHWDMVEEAHTGE